MSPHVLIAGGSGFVGQALAAALLAHGSRVTIGSRGSATPTPAAPGAAVRRYDDLPGDVDAVVNLAGASIAGRRWTAAYKRVLVDSRVDFTRTLIAGLRARGIAPAVWINASATGIYGDRGDEPLHEDSPPGTGFLADLCQAWEAAAAEAGPALGARVAVLRFGVVLARDGGALPTMALPFKLFVGGPIGRGRQFMAWIHREDLVELVRWALADDAARGTYNATAPVPCTNLELSRALARALHRPCLIPVPPLALRIVLGEVARYLTQSQRALPSRALAQGFAFRYPQGAAAIAALYAGR